MATSPYSDGPVTLDQQYESASNTSDLAVSGGPMMPLDGHATPAGDVVAAAGLVGGRLKPDGAGGYVLLPPNPTSIGMALLRLHSEFSAAAKPKRVGHAVVLKLAEDIRRQDAREREASARRKEPYAAPEPAHKRAQAEADRWYANELRILATRLKSRAAVLEELTMWGAVKGVPAETIAAGLAHWLSPSCQRCDGLGLLYRENAAVRPCGCNHGETPTTDQVDYVVNHIKACLGMARRSLKMRLRRG